MREKLYKEFLLNEIKTQANQNNILLSDNEIKEIAERELHVFNEYLYMEFSEEYNSYEQALFDKYNVVIEE